ncbi:MAG: response regulator transcription factor [Lachnospiraceae bacterium]|nr:response regulator transcription factor [Lachnospiraceae bacterium]
MEEIKILVVDDEARMRKLVGDFLKKSGYLVLEAGDGEEAEDIFFSDHKIGLVILDVMMPKLDGWEVLKNIRQVSDVPVIMLTARTQEQDELLGFKLGVDEYVTKPFSPKVLVARVEAILRRSGQITEDELVEGKIKVDMSAHQVYSNGQCIDLSAKEFELLVYFMKNKNKALPREAILNHVWNFDYVGDARTIDTHVKKLRSKLGATGSYIKTIWGVGYKFEVIE